MAPDDLSLGTGRTGGREATTGVIPGRFALSVGMPDSVPPKGWKWTPLSSVAQLESGHTPSRRHAEYWDGDIPWVGIRDATENHGRTINDTLQHVTEIGLDNSSARLLPANTVCLSRTASVGFVIVMGRPMATSQDFVNWVCGPKLDAHFLKYVLLAENEALWRFASGTTHQTIYYPEAKAFHVCLPPLAEQQAIAGVLGSLDNKIELNRRMNATLEAMARALFQSWFMDFDPVRAKLEGRPTTNLDPVTAALFPASFQDSTLGTLPEGWRLCPLGDLSCYLGRGIGPAYIDGGGVCVVNQKCIRGHRVDLSKTRRHDDKKKSVSGRALEVGDVLVNSTGVGTLGRVAQVQFLNEQTIVDSHVTVVRANAETDSSFLGMALIELEDAIEQLGEGSTGQTELSRARLGSLRVVTPPAAVQRAFGAVVRPLLSRISENERQSCTLATLRDTLLPKLLSGEHSVSTAAETIP